MSLLQVTIAGVDFKNPIIAASGAYGFGREYNRLYPIGKLGGVSCKGTTLHTRSGNPAPRIAETPSGILNSVGLENPGVDHVLEFDLPWILKQGTVVISNVAGSTVEETCATVEKFSESKTDMIELNISCPNVKQGGAAFGVCADSAAAVTREVRRVCKKPLIVKLSPNVADIGEIAKAVEAEGADALSLINTLTGMRIDIKTRRPILRNNTGGLSGPAVFPVAVRMVSEVYRQVQIPIIGLGGVASWQDGVEMMLAGASAIQVGTAMFTDPFTPLKIIDGMEEYVREQGLSNISELTGAAKLWE